MVVRRHRAAGALLETQRLANGGGGCGRGRLLLRTPARACARSLSTVCVCDSRQEHQHANKACSQATTSKQGLSVQLSCSRLRGHVGGRKIWRLRGNCRERSSLLKMRGKTTFLPSASSNGVTRLDDYQSSLLSWLMRGWMDRSEAPCCCAVRLLLLAANCAR